MVMNETKTHTGNQMTELLAEFFSPMNRGLTKLCSFTRTKRASTMLTKARFVNLLKFKQWKTNERVEHKERTFLSHNSFEFIPLTAKDSSWHMMSLFSLLTSFILLALDDGG